MIVPVVNNPTFQAYRKSSSAGTRLRFHFSEIKPRNDFPIRLSKRFLTWVSWHGDAEWPWTFHDDLMYGGI